MCCGWAHNSCAGVDDEDEEAHICECCQREKNVYSLYPIALSNIPSGIMGQDGIFDMCHVDPICQKNM